MSSTDPAGKDVRRTLTRTVALPLTFALLLGAILVAEVFSLLSLQRWVERAREAVAKAGARAETAEKPKRTRKKKSA